MSRGWGGGGCHPPGPALGKGGRTRLEGGSSMGPGVQGLCQLETGPQEWCHSWLGGLGQVIPSLSVLDSSSAKWDGGRALADLSGVSEAPRGSVLQAHESVQDHLCPSFSEPMPCWEIWPHYLSGSSDRSKSRIMTHFYRWENWGGLFIILKTFLSFYYCIYFCCAGFLLFSFGSPLVLEKEMATYSSALAWKIPWTEEPGRVQSMG